MDGVRPSDRDLRLCGHAFAGRNGERVPRPTNRNDLLAAASTEFDRLFEAVDQVPEERRGLTGACAGWSVKDVLAHLDAWHRLFLDWESIGSGGGEPHMPATGFTWADTPALNARLHDERADDPWDEVVESLRSSHRRVIAVIASYDDDELFTKRRFKWTGSTSVGSYAVSATASHYAWASKHVRAWSRRR